MRSTAAALGLLPVLLVPLILPGASRAAPAEDPAPRGAAGPAPRATPAGTPAPRAAPAKDPAPRATPAKGPPRVADPDPADRKDRRDRGDRWGRGDRWDSRDSRDARYRELRRARRDLARGRYGACGRGTPFGREYQRYQRYRARRGDDARFRERRGDDARFRERRGDEGRDRELRRARRCVGWACDLRVRFGLEGFYSADMTYIRDLANLKGSVLPNTSLLREPLTSTGYFTHHLRMEPSLSVGKLATLYLRLDGIQHVVWGDNDARAQSPLFAGSPTNTNDYGEQTASFQLVWAWLDLDLKLGKLRVGRMPSHWGMGLLSNGGGDLTQSRGGVDDDFADNRHPSIYDRILFATKPLQVIKTIAKAKDPTSNWLLAYAYDRLVEEPYWRDISLEAQRAYGESAFLSRQLNNVDEHVLVLAYSDPKFLSHVKALDRWQDKGFTAGVYAVYRRQGRQDRILRYNVDGSSTYTAYDCAGTNVPPACGARSQIGIVDPYLRLKLGPILVETESYFIFGKTEPGRGIPIGSEVGKALIYGWVTRAGWNPREQTELLLDVGQASGDKVYGNEVFRQRAMHADYVPGLILYRMFLRERSATALAQSLNSNVAGVPTPSRGLQSNGGVQNSYFLYPRIRWTPHPMLTLKVALLTAWSHRPEQYLFRVTGCEKGVKGAGCRIEDNHIGTEVDVGVDVRWGGVPGIEHLLFRFDMGYLVFGKQVASDYDAPGVFALRMRLMFVF